MLYLCKHVVAALHRAWSEQAVKFAGLHNAKRNDQMQDMLVFLANCI